MGCWRRATVVADKTRGVRRREKMISSESRSSDSVVTTSSIEKKRKNDVFIRSASKPPKLKNFCNKNDEKFKSFYRAKRIILATIIVTGIILIIAGCYINKINRIQSYSINENNDGEFLVPPDPEIDQPPTWSKLRIFKRGAVCADGAPCAEIGKSMLDRNGSAVDAALAALICNGLINMQSMGIGGGFIMTLYERSTGKGYFLNSRETAPINSAHDMYDNKSSMASRIGGLAIGVPGEIAGYSLVHEKFGKLPWAELFYPSIELCKNGYNLTKEQYDALSVHPPNIYEDSTLRKMFVDPETGEFKKPGSLIKPEKLCETMKLIAEKKGTFLYNGTLGERLIEDLKKRGSILTMKDLNDYRPVWGEPIQINITNDMKLISSGLPSSGPILAFILNILREYRLGPHSLENLNNTITTYHRIIETFKYAYAIRTQLADGDFVDLSEIIEKLRSREYATFVRENIKDYKTWNDIEHYGATNSGPENHGTAHISVLSPNGDAVSVTSSINLYFGSGVVSESTGILLNSAMDDFGISSNINYFGVPPGRNNNIQPGKRSFSSMAPSIIVQGNGNVRMIVGAAGGTKITTSVSYVIARHLWMKDTIKQAIDAARIHHQLIPMEISYEFGVPRPVIDGLNKLGHKTSRYRNRGSVVCAIVQINGTIYANADYRKNGDVYVCYRPSRCFSRW